MASEENKGLMLDLRGTQLQLDSHQKDFNELCDKIEKKLDDLELKDKALDKACEKLYDKGYNEQCKFKMCEVATTFYEGDYDKKICSSCHKDYMLEQAKEELENNIK